MSYKLLHIPTSKYVHECSVDNEFVINYHLHDNYIIDRAFYTDSIIFNSKFNIGTNILLVSDISYYLGYSVIASEFQWIEASGHDT